MKRELDYLLQTLHWLLQLLRDRVTVYCIIDIFECFEHRSSETELDRLLTVPLDLSERSCDSPGEVIDLKASAHESLIAGQYNSVRGVLWFVSDDGQI